MRISCQQCAKGFNLPEDKIPEKGSFRFSCPACGAKNTIVLDQENTGRPREQAQSEPRVQQPPKQTVEPEVHPPGAQVALLFVQDPIWLEKAGDFLKTNDFSLSLAQTPEEATQKLRLNRYQLVLIEDDPQAGVLLREISQWSGRFRREVNCVLVGDQGQSFDHLTAFLKGVNTYLSKADRDQAEPLLEQAREQWVKHLQPFRAAGPEA